MVVAIWYSTLVTDMFFRLELDAGFSVPSKWWCWSCSVRVSHMCKDNARQDQNEEARWSSHGYDSELHRVPKDLQNQKCSFDTLYKATWWRGSVAMDHQLDSAVHHLLTQVFLNKSLKQNYHLIIIDYILCITGAKNLATVLFIWLISYVST